MPTADNPSLARTTAARRSAYQVAGYMQRVLRALFGSSATGDPTLRPLDLLGFDGLRDLLRTVPSL